MTLINRTASPLRPDGGKYLITRYVDDVLNQRDADAVREIFSPAFVDHDPQLPGLVGIRGVARFVEILRAPGFDVWFTLEDLVGEEDRVGYRLFAEGIVILPHESLRALRRSPNRQAGTVHMVTRSSGMYRIEDGKVREHWGLRRITIQDRPLSPLAAEDVSVRPLVPR